MAEETNETIVCKPHKGPAPGYKAPIKYRGPNGETWTGRGKMPLWMVAAGGDKEQFRVWTILEDKIVICATEDAINK